ncbi:MAG: hypothetical protein ABI901_13795 [Roseiflexaceae bacterium]
MGSTPTRSRACQIHDRAVLRLCNRIRRDRQMHRKSRPRAYFTHDRFFDQQRQRATKRREHRWLLPARRIQVRIGEHREHAARLGGQRLDRRANLLLLGLMLLIRRNQPVGALDNRLFQRRRQRLADHRHKRLLALLCQNGQLLFQQSQCVE